MCGVRVRGLTPGTPAGSARRLTAEGRDVTTYVLAGWLAAGLMLLLFDRIEQMTRRRLVGFTCETHDWDY
jgi:hypothetical protein